MIGEGIAMDNNVWMEVATEMTSTTGGVEILPTPVLATSMVGHEGPHETGETDGGGKKVGDQDDDEEGSSEEDEIPRHRGQRLRRLRPGADIRPERWAVAVRM